MVFELVSWAGWVWLVFIGSIFFGVVGCGSMTSYRLLLIGFIDWLTGLVGWFDLDFDDCFDFDFDDCFDVDWLVDGFDWLMDWSVDLSLNG